MKAIYSKALLAVMLAACTSTAVSVQAQKAYTLKECRALAIENNVAMKKANLDIESAKRQREEAKAKYLPAVSAGVTYFHATDYLLKEKVEASPDQLDGIGQTLSQMGLDPSALSSLPTSYTLEVVNHGTLVNLMAMEPIYAGGQITNGNRLAELQIEVRRLMLEQSKDDIIATTEKYYNQIVALQEKINTVEVADKQLQGIMKDAELAYKVGVSNKNDVLKVQLKQNENDANRLKVRNAMALSKMVLSQYIGLGGQPLEVDCSLVSDLPQPSSYLADPVTALNGRTESRLLGRNVKASELQTKMAKGEMLPTLAVGAAGLYQDLTSISKVKGIGFVTLSVPVSNWWGNKKVKRQKIAEEKARLDYQDNREKILIQIQNAYNEFENSYRLVEIARKSVVQSRENLRLNENYYKAGTCSMVDLLDAQTQEQQSRDKYTEAVTGYLNCRTAYLIATNRQVE